MLSSAVEGHLGVPLFKSFIVMSEKQNYKIAYFVNFRFPIQATLPSVQAKTPKLQRNIVISKNFGTK